MALYTVTNSALGARMVGPILVEADASIEVELTENEAVLFSELDGVTIAELKKKKETPDAK
jgi:hypothetical protein